MTDYDKELIAKAEKTNCVDWYLIEAMMKQAETPEAAEELRLIRNRKYHMEEYGAGLL